MELDSTIPCNDAAVTEADVAFFEAHGYFVTGKIIPEDILEEAAYGVRRYYEGERNQISPSPAVSSIGAPNTGRG